MIGTGIGLGLAGYRLNPPGVLPVLDLRFATDKSLTAFAGPTPSFSRASSGTYFDASGVLQSAGVNAARFNHVFNGTSWVSRGLLVEEQRTQRITYTDFSSVWTLSGSTGSASAGTSPDGTNNAYLIYPSSTGTFRSIYQAAGASNCVSIFAKASGMSWLCHMNIGGNAGAAWFNLSNGTVGTVASGYTASIANCGNGWYRCSVSHSSNFSYLQPSATDGDNTSTGTANGTNGILLYGPQTESGAFTTSFIPNLTSSSVTRSADVCQITGGDFSNIWNATEGTFACEVFPSASGVIVNQGIFTANSGTFANVIGQIKNLSNTDGDYGAFVRTSNSNQVLIERSSGSMPGGQLSKAAFAYKQNDFADSLNGAAALTDLSGTIPTVDQMTIGDFHPNAGTIFNGHIARLRYYRTRLENGTLRVLST